ncbi:MAG: type II toxin-antitoxin system VapC family toxin [Planctomycetes bacterium]|nr:type II toxin-antitoxin system VapC family toxin [Planctomycetota bacterium]
MKAIVEVFLDTNIFLYAAGEAHPLRAPCQDVLWRVVGGSLRGTTNTEVIQELIYVLHRRNRLADALRLARSILALFPGLWAVTSAEISVACGLLERYPDLPIRDALHAATMKTHGIRTLISADEHFDLIDGIRRLDPTSVS